MTIRNGGERAARATLGPELLERLLEFVHGKVTGCVGVGLHASSRSEGPITSSGLAEKLDALQWELGTGPVVHTATAHEAITAPDLARDERWPELAARISALSDVPVPLAVIAVAGSWDDEGPIVLSLYLDHEATADDLRVVEEIEPVLAMSAALVEYCADEVLRGDQLLKMVEHRRIIEQAKGMIMTARGCDAGVAFRTLVLSSQHFNVKLRDLAVATVELIGAAPAEGPPPELADELGEPTAPGNEARRAAELMWAALQEG
ncbi:ANTAR domain-containing protein [Amycolatopsis anabasis]|uniref:ANTAR domain-containing protein n=1 Tax=Amycolatopsis anabasis TaxID=1840409 RepID=UPI00131B0D64|nr:ANTAR domain-containing protein [Amycolatopsis anabasis]